LTLSFLLGFTLNLKLDFEKISDVDEGGSREGADVFVAMAQEWLDVNDVAFVPGFAGPCERLRPTDGFDENIGGRVLERAGDQVDA
jgi:hypothetical protein